jgi:DNA-nicking Smr family endonuclease
MSPRRRSPDRGSRARPAGRSLRDQVKALPPAIVPPREPGARPKTAREAGGVVAPAPSAPKGLSFKDLAAGVAPLPEPARAILVPGPALVAAPRRIAPKIRLWVEHRDGMVLARAEGVPARLIEELRSGRVVPRREIDLHRRSAAEARQLLQAGVCNARRDGLVCLLVVCGRGIHSGAEGPVLPDVAVEQLSEELASEVLAFCTAPRKWGGEGALIVRLRAPTSPR